MKSPDTCTKYRRQWTNNKPGESMFKKTSQGTKMTKGFINENQYLNCIWKQTGNQDRTQQQWLGAAVPLELASGAASWKQSKAIPLPSTDASLFPSFVVLGYIWAHFHPCCKLITKNPEVWEWTGNTVGCCTNLSTICWNIKMLV